jgi:hypothetical protein
MQGLSLLLFEPRLLLLQLLQDLLAVLKSRGWRTGTSGGT